MTEGICFKEYKKIGDFLKVLHLLNYIGKGGSEAYINNLAIAMNNKGIENYLLYNIDGGGLATMKENGIKTTQLKMNSILDIKSSKFIKKFVKENNIDVVHTHFLRENAIAFLSQKLGMKVPIINTRHMITKLSKSQIFINKIVFTSNRKVIAVSKMVKEQLIKQGVNSDKIVVISPPLKEKISLNAIDKPEDEIWILSVGRLSSEKGCMFFLETLKDIFSENIFPTLKIKIIGSGPLEEDMKKFLENNALNDKVEMLGYIENPFAKYKNADIYVNHSAEESFGMSIVEAVQYEIPIVAPRESGITDYFNEENNSCLMYNYGDKDEFIKVLKEMIKDSKLRLTIKENSKKVFENDFSQTKIVKKIEEIYLGE